MGEAHWNMKHSIFQCCFLPFSHAHRFLNTICPRFRISGPSTCRWVSMALTQYEVCFEQSRNAERAFPFLEKGILSRSDHREKEKPATPNKRAIGWQRCSPPNPCVWQRSPAYRVISEIQTVHSDWEVVSATGVTRRLHLSHSFYSSKVSINTLVILRRCNKNSGLLFHRTTLGERSQPPRLLNTQVFWTVLGYVCIHQLKRSQVSQEESTRSQCPWRAAAACFTTASRSVKSRCRERSVWAMLTSSRTRRLSDVNATEAGVLSMSYLTDIISCWREPWIVSL